MKTKSLPQKVRGRGMGQRPAWMGVGVGVGNHDCFYHFEYFVVKNFFQFISLNRLRSTIRTEIKCFFFTTEKSRVPILSPRPSESICDLRHFTPRQALVPLGRVVSAPRTTLPPAVSVAFLKKWKF